MSVPVRANQLLVLEDVVRSLGGSGFGALTVDRQYRHLLVASRSLSLSGEGTAGYSLSGVPPYSEELWVHGDGARLTVLGVDGSEGHRTAVGWLGTGPFGPGTLAVRLFDADGRYLGGELYPVGDAGCNWAAPQRLDDVFAELGAPGQAGCRVELEVVEGDARATGYAVVTDLLSGDATYSPALRIPEGLPFSFSVHHRESALLVDGLNESVGFSRLPPGTFSASFDGTGNLGREELPTHVVCVYQEATSAMRVAALRFGEGIDSIAGESPFWCFIPDWMSKTDNSGSATVTLTGGGTVLDLDLDPQENCVLLDTRPESELVESVLAREYDIETYGHLGQPDVEPQVLVMYRDADTGRLVAAVVTDGDRIAPVDPAHRLLVVAPDWYDLWDNSGWTTLHVVLPLRPPFPEPQWVRARVSGSMGRAGDR